MSTYLAVLLVALLFVNCFARIQIQRERAGIVRQHSMIRRLVSSGSLVRRT